MWDRILRALRLDDPRVRRWTVGLLVVAPLVLVVTAGLSGAVDPIAGIAAGNAAMLFVLGLLLDHLARAREELTETAESFKGQISESVARDLSRAPGIVATYRDIEAVPWADLFEEAHVKVEILARFFNVAVGPAQQHQALVRFLKRGGRLTVITSDFRVAETMAAVTAQRDPTKRFYPRGVSDRIVNCLHHLSDAAETAGVGEEAVAVFLRTEPLNYAGYCFDGRDLILSPTEHAFRSRYRSPRLRIDLHLAEGFRDFWSSELEALTSGSSERLSRLLPQPTGMVESDRPTGDNTKPVTRRGRVRRNRR